MPIRGESFGQLEKARKDKKVKTMLKPLMETEIHEVKKGISPAVWQTVKDILELNISGPMSPCDWMLDAIHEAAISIASAEGKDIDEVEASIYEGLRKNKEKNNELKDLVTKGFEKRFDQLVVTWREINGKPSNRQKLDEEISFILKAWESNNFDFGASRLVNRKSGNDPWLTRRLERERSYWEAEFRTSQYQWGTLEVEMEPNDIVELKAVISTPILRDLMLRFREIRPLFEHSSQEARHAWDQLVRNTLEERITGLLDSAEFLLLTIPNIMREISLQKIAWKALSENQREEQKMEHKKRKAELTQRLKQIQFDEKIITEFFMTDHEVIFGELKETLGLYGNVAMADELRGRFFAELNRRGVERWRLSEEKKVGRHVKQRPANEIHYSLQKGDPAYMRWFGSLPSTRPGDRENIKYDLRLKTAKPRKGEVALVTNKEHS